MIIYEVGVGPFSTCRSRPYWDKHECVLFEPLISYYKEIKQAIGKRSNIQLHNIAINDYNGHCDFLQNGQLSFLKGIKSPQIQFGIHGGNLTQCRCAKISEFDKGNIDLLFLDMEGAEWFALKHLVSQPKKIVVETQLPTYRNPFLNEIKDWMQKNKYKQVNKVGADTVWEKVHHKVFV